MSETGDLVWRREGHVGHITLNRPHALHALTLAMCEGMTNTLLAWRDDPAIELVLLDHAGERGFCAGGDVRMLAESGAAGGEAARMFFRTEYRLNHLLFHYPKPTAAFLDGIVMGGGVGIGLPCRYRIATERTVFAMPETGIGLFPDVGGGWYLPRLPGQAGLWLGLSGARLKASDCRMLGIATHYADREQLAALKSALIAGEEPGAVLSRFAGEPGAAPLAPMRATLDAAFGAADVAGVIAALDAHGDAWASAQADILRTRSPQALLVTFRHMRTGADFASFAECLRTEYRLAVRSVARHDFHEGVRALLIDKDNAPRWSPPSLQDVSSAMLDQIFAPFPAAEEWTPLGEEAA